MHSDSLNSLTTDILSNMCSEQMKHKSKSALDILQKASSKTTLTRKFRSDSYCFLGFQNQIFSTEEHHETT